MNKKQLIEALIAAPAPRPDPIVYPAARKLFPTWQAIFVGAPLMLMLAPTLATVAALAVALPLGALVGEPYPTWFGVVTTGAMLIGAAAGVYLIVRWMRRRRASFVELARAGVLVPTFDIEARGLGRVVGSSVGRAAVGLALGGAVGGTLSQVYGGPIVAAEVDGEIIEARSVAAGARGQFRVPSHMLVHRGARYVALVDGDGWIVPQRVLRRRPMSPSA